jgi:aspartate carbamoyltransferase catalytic subunit
MSSLLQKTSLQHLLGIEDLNAADIIALLDRAQFLQEQQLEYIRSISALLSTCFLRIPPARAPRLS